MTPNQRVVLNIFATYGRTVIGVLCGIFSTRWVLMALGKEDFGLFGLVGSLVVFLSFLNIQFAGALSRFFAYSVGQANVAADSDEALEECRKWFSVGVMLHTLMPLILVLVGYPVGAWAIKTGVVGVPAYRIDACIWLWRFVCISTFISMVNVPFNAMYIAKQYIAELTIYSLVQTFARTGFIYFMTLQQGDWLVTYGLATCVIMIVPQLLICCRAVMVFKECRLRVKYLVIGSYVKKLASYAGWQTFGGLGYIARHQFLTVVVNRFFGPKITASFSVGSTVSTEAAALTGALNGAFAPAITTACGEGNWDRLRKMAYQASKFGTLLTLIFAIPIALEIDSILNIWLKEVPEWSNGICLIMLAVVVVEKFSLGHIIGVNAFGRVAMFQVCRGLACMMAIPFSIVFALIFNHVYSVAIALLIITFFACLSDVLVARIKIGLNIRYWLFKIIIPLCIVSMLTYVVGMLPRYLIKPSFGRVVITTIVVLFGFIPLSWFFVLNSEERMYVYQKLKNVIRRIKND